MGSERAAGAFAHLTGSRLCRGAESSRWWINITERIPQRQPACAVHDLRIRQRARPEQIRHEVVGELIECAGVLHMRLRGVHLGGIDEPLTAPP